MKKKIPLDMQAGTIHSTNNCGHLEVVEYKSWDKVTVRFISTGFTATVRAEKVRNGMIKDLMFPVVYGVGFIGKGEYSAGNGVSGKHSPAYTRWHGMFKRCYSLDPHYRAYKDCTVCKKWHNFQNFAEWFKDNYPKDGGVYDLDKDIKIDGNKVYSPSSCMFVSPIENKDKAKSIEFSLLSPNGVAFTGRNITKFAKEHGINKSNLCQVLLGSRNSAQGWTKA